MQPPRAPPLLKRYFARAYAAGSTPPPAPNSRRLDKNRRFNGLIELVRRVARGFRNAGNCRLRMLPSAVVYPTLEFEEPSNRDRGGNARGCHVVPQLDIPELKGINLAAIGVEPELRQRSRCAGELFACLLKMV